MTDGIVAGYDGSPGSQLALRWAVREACDRQVKLTVCHAWAPDYLTLLSEASVFDLARQRGEEILAEGVSRAGTITGSGSARPLLARGPAARILCERSSTADMIVVGSRGHGTLPGLLLGSVAWQLAGHGQGRIVIVRGTGRSANRPPGPVVGGLDGSAASLAVLEFACEEAALRNVPVLAVCALADAPQTPGGARQIAEDYHHLLTWWEKEHPGVTVLQHVSHSSPREALLKAEPDAQMVLVGSRGRGGIRPMTLGSVASAVVHHAPCPVGVVGPSVVHEDELLV